MSKEQNQQNCIWINGSWFKIPKKEKEKNLVSFLQSENFQEPPSFSKNESDTEQVQLQLTPSI